MTKCCHCQQLFRPPGSLTKYLREQSLDYFREVRFRSRCTDERTIPLDATQGLFVLIQAVKNRFAPSTIDGLCANLYLKLSEQAGCWVGGRLWHDESSGMTHRFEFWPDDRAVLSAIRFIGHECSSNIILMELAIPGSPTPVTFKNPLGPRQTEAVQETSCFAIDGLHNDVLK